MPAPDRTYRLADCGIYLRQVMRLPHTAQVVYFYLREGPRSQRSYVVEVNYPEIAGRLSTSVPAARRAVAQLVDAGLLELDEAAELGWLCADARRFPPANSSVTTSILRDLPAYTTSVLLTKVRDFLTATRDTVPDTVPDTVRHTQGVRDSGIQGTRANPQTTTPPASAPQAEPVKPKVKKEKPKGPPRSHRAGDEIAAWWNGSLAQLGNAPCSGDRAWLVKYGKVAEAAAQAVGCLETIGLMMRWAYEADNYHAGRMSKGQRRTWRLEQWLAREHFEEMHAECVRARYLDDPFIDWSNRTIKELDHEASDAANQDPAAKAAA